METSSYKTDDFTSLLKEEIKTFHDFPKEGIAFKDLQSILMRPELTQGLLFESMSLFRVNDLQIDAILGFDARGFILGGALSVLLEVPLILARKEGKLPGELVVVSFEKEYGTDTLSIQKGLIKPGMKVLVHDDLLATGGTAGAAVELIQKEGGEVSGFHFLMELDYLSGRRKIEKFGKIISMVNFSNPGE